MNKVMWLPPLFFALLFAWERIFPAKGSAAGALGHTVSNLSVALTGSLFQFLFLIVVAPWATQWALDGSFGFLHRVRLPFWPQMAAAFLLQDLWMYAWHRANHRFSFFWRFHRAHHNDVQLDVTTALRFHPVEILFSIILNTGVLLLAGLSLHHLIAYNAFFLGVIFFHHSRVAFGEKWDRFLRCLIVSPHLHRVHHSIEYRQNNANYGSVFSFWDRLFVTFVRSPDPALIVFGLKIFRDVPWQRPWGILRIPFVPGA